MAEFTLPTPGATGSAKLGLLYRVIPRVTFLFRQKTGKSYTSLPTAVGVI